MGLDLSAIYFGCTESTARLNNDGWPSSIATDLTSILPPGTDRKTRSFRVGSVDPSKVTCTGVPPSTVMVKLCRSASHSDRRVSCAALPGGARTAALSWLVTDAPCPPAPMPSVSTPPTTASMQDPASSMQMLLLLGLTVMAYTCSIEARHQSA